MIDRVARVLTPGQRDTLAVLSRHVVAQLELRRHTAAQKRLLKKHENAETRLRLLEAAVENASDVILITEAEPFGLPGPRIVYVNPAFTRNTGYRAEDVLGKTPRILQGPGTDPAIRAQIRAALEGWKPVRVELLNYRKDGSEFWVELNIVPITNEKGWCTHWVSVQRDISARKAQEQTRESAHLEMERRVEERTGELAAANAALQAEIAERKVLEEQREIF